jgi:hypothetical protein
LVGGNGHVSDQIGLAPTQLDGIERSAPGQMDVPTADDLEDEAFQGTTFGMEIFAFLRRSVFCVRDKGCPMRFEYYTLPDEKKDRAVCLQIDVSVFDVVVFDAASPDTDAACSTFDEPSKSIL